MIGIAEERLTKRCSLLHCPHAPTCFIAPMPRLASLPPCPDLHAFNWWHTLRCSDPPATQSKPTFLSRYSDERRIADRARLRKSPSGRMISCT